jgi:hypothetical protein
VAGGSTPVVLERPVGLGRMCVQTVVKGLPSYRHLWHSGRSFVGFNDVVGGFEAP